MTDHASDSRTLEIIKYYVYDMSHIWVSSTSLFAIEILGRCRKRWRLRHFCCFGFPKRTLLGMWLKQERRARHISRYPSSDNSAAIMFSGFSLIYNSYSYSFIRLSLEVPLYSYPNVVLNAADICNLKVGSPLPALKGIPEVPSLRQCPT